MLKKFDQVSEEIKRKCITEVIARVEEIDSENVGMIAAQEIIDIVTDCYGPAIYNIALADAKKLAVEKLSDLDIELDNLNQ